MAFSRKRFLVTLSVASAASVVERQTKALADAAPSPKPRAEVSPPSPAAPSPSAAAHAFALRMREFDGSLTEEKIHEIAKGIDDAWKSGRKLHAGLTNGDGPSPPFQVGD